MLSKFAPLALTACLLACRLGERSEAHGGSPAVTAASAAPSAKPLATLFVHSAEPAPPPPAVPAPAPASASAAEPAPGAEPAPKKSVERVLVLGDSLSDPKVVGRPYWRHLELACARVQIESAAKGGM